MVSNPFFPIYFADSFLLEVDFLYLGSTMTRRGMKIALTLCALATTILLSCCHNNSGKHIKVTQPTLPLASSWVSDAFGGPVLSLLS